jgi:hypothetical protein
MLKQAIEIIKYCFWNVENTNMRLPQELDNLDLYLQLREIQRRLLIEKGVAWVFKIKRQY